MVGYPFHTSRKDVLTQANNVVMDTYVDLYADGKLEGKTHVWAQGLGGAHATAGIVFFDRHNSEIWRVGPVACGVAGKAEFWSNHDRTCSIEAKIPENVMPYVSSLAIVNSYADYSAFGRWLGTHWQEVVNVVVKIWETVSSDSGGINDISTVPMTDAQYQAYALQIQQGAASPQLAKAQAAATSPPQIFTAVADTYVRADQDLRKNDNYGHDRNMNVGTGRGSSVGPMGVPDAERALVRFDLTTLSGHVKAAALTLTIHSLGGTTNAPYTVGVYQITQPWQEGDGAEGYADLVPATVGTDAASGVAWEAVDPNNQAQPTFAPSVIAQQTIDPQTAKPGARVTLDITSLVQQWVEQPSTNYGLMLRDVTTGGSFRELRFGTREGDLYPFPDKVQGPRLVVWLG